jgi:tartrate-resistant acid phosphatase type 5
VVGDWGRDGLYNQTIVAKQMGIVGTKLNIDFVISTGDNFYEKGLTGPDDTQFTTSFSDVYTQESLQTPWYSGALNYPTVLHTHAGKVVQDECSILSDLM